MSVIYLNSGKTLHTENIKETMMDLLSKKAFELGRIPLFDEVRSDPEMPSPNAYAFYYGSYKEAATASIHWNKRVENDRALREVIDNKRKKSYAKRRVAKRSY